MSGFSSNSHETDISKSAAPLHIKFALFCLIKTSVPRWLGYLCFLLSHLQAFAMILRCAYIGLPDNTPSSSPAIQVFIKLFVIGSWLSHTNTAQLLVGTVLITLYSVKVVSLMIYIHLFLHKKRKIPDAIQNYWNMLHNMHPLVLFFWIHTFCMEIINYSKRYDFFQGVDIFFTAMAYFNSILNCIMALIFSVIAVTYKTKDALSAKTRLLEIKSVVFKIITPVLWIAADHNEGAQILTLVLCLISAILHDWIFHRYFPYYRINMSFFSAVLQAAQTSLSAVAFIVKLVELRRPTTGILSVQVVWLLVFPLLAKAYHLWTWRIMFHILVCEPIEEKNIAYLIHKRFILLYFAKSRKILHEGVGKLQVHDLMYQAKLNRVEFDSGTPKDQLDRNKKLLIKNLKAICVRILSIYPKAFLAQINLAYFYSKFEDLYLMTNSLIEDVISRHPGYHAQISLSMIRYELQKKLSLQFSRNHSETQEQGQCLNVYNYILNKDLHEQVKNSIERQARIQSSFWKEFLQSKPSMLRLMNIALEVNSQKQVVKKQWNNLLKIRPLSFLSPLILYGMYSSLINNDSIEGERYIEQSHEDAKRLRRFLKMNELNNDTVFSDKTVTITMSGLKSKLGKILGCSDNISSSFGWQSKEMNGKPISTLMPPFYRQRHDRFLNAHYNTGKTKILNKTSVLPVKGANGFLVPTWIHVKVSPLVENGISYVALLKPMKPNQRMILIRKDGKIDDMSLEFAQDMNLTRDKEHRAQLNITTLCPEFKQVNDAFNIIADNTLGVCSTTNSDLQVCKLDRSSGGLTARNRTSSNPLPKTAAHLPVCQVSTRRDYQQETEGDTSILDKSLIQGDTSRITTERPLLMKANEGSPQSEKKGKPISSSEMRAEKIYQSSDIQDNGIQGIYEDFVAGSTLIFYPRNTYPTIGNRISLFTMESDHHYLASRSTKPITYNVKIENKIHGKEAIKFVMLEKVAHTNYSDDNLKDGNSSDEQRTGTSPSSKMVSKEFDRDAKKKKRDTAFDFKDELVSPSFPQSSSFSPPKWKAEDGKGGSIYLNSPPKMKPDLNFLDVTDEKRKSSEGVNLSILDEVQSNDFVNRKAVFRSIVDEKGSSASPVRKGAVVHHQNVSFSQIADEVDVSFSPDQLQKRGSGRASFAMSQAESNEVKAREGRKSITYAHYQFLDLFGGRRDSASKDNMRSSTIKQHRSTWFHQGEELPKEDKLLKAKFKNLKKRLEDAVINANKAENSVTSSYISKGKKVQHLVSQALKLDPQKKSATVFLSSFILFVISMVILLAIQTIHLTTGITTVQSQIPVITTAYFRQNSMISSSSGVRMWNAVIQGDYTTGDWMSDNLGWLDYLDDYAEDMKEYNTELYTHIYKISSKAQSRFYEKNVGIYEYAEDGSKTLISMASTFEAFQMMIEKEYNCLNFNIPSSWSPNIDNSDFIFVLDNILNDLLIQSQNQIEELTYEMDDSTQSTNTRMAWTLAVVLGVCLIFLVISMRYLYLMTLEAKLFMTMIFRMKPRDCEVIQVILQRFRSALSTNLKDLELPGEERVKKEESQQSMANSAKFRSGSMDALYKEQRIAFLQLLPNFVVFICWSIVYFFLTRNFIQNINFCETQMETALQALNNQSLFLAEFIDISLTNGTAIIKNQNFMADFLLNLRYIQDTNTLAAKFRDKNGQLTPLQEKLIYDFPCDELLTFDEGKFSWAYESCVTIGAGDPSTGLVDINSGFYLIGRYLLEKYEEGPKTKADLAQLFIEGLIACSELVDLAESFLIMLYESTHQNFENEVDTVTTKTIIFTLTIFAASLVGTIVTWFLVVKKIFNIQKVDRHILQVIPIKLILSNKHLQQYLLKHSDGILDGVKSFL